MAEMTFMEAIRETIRSEMKKDPTLFIIGEDVGKYGGEHGVSGDLWQQFGDDRVRDAPIAEASIVGCGLGAAITGCKAISEIPFGDFVGMCMDHPGRARPLITRRASKTGSYTSPASKSLSLQHRRTQRDCCAPP